MTLSDLWPAFQGRNIFWSRILENRRVLKTKLLLHKRNLYVTYGTVLFMVTFTAKRAARVCQHQLSFLLLFRYITMCPKGDVQEASDYVTVYLCLDSCPNKEVFATCEFSIENSDGQKVHVTSEYLFSASLKLWLYVAIRILIMMVMMMISTMTIIITMISIIVKFIFARQYVTGGVEVVCWTSWSRVRILASPLLSATLGKRH